MTVQFSSALSSARLPISPLFLPVFFCLSSLLLFPPNLPMLLPLTVAARRSNGSAVSAAKPGVQELHLGLSSSSGAVLQVGTQVLTS